MGTEEQQEIMAGDLVKLSLEFMSENLSTGLVTKVLVPYEEVEVYWNESFPQENEYVPQLVVVQKATKT